MRKMKRKHHIPTVIKIIAIAVSALLTLGLLIITFLPFVIDLLRLMFASSGMILAASATVLLLAIIIFWAFTKPLRLRVKMIFSLKKMCKKQGYKYGYTLNMSQSLLSPKWRNGIGEIIFYTNTRAYHIRLFAIRKYRSILRFESENEITVIEYPSKNTADVAIYNFGGGQKRASVISSENSFISNNEFNTKHKKFKIDFSKVTDTAGKETVKAVIICPTCAEWYYRKSNSTYIPTGNAETVFGYKVYTASGFISDIKRSEQC